MPRPVSGLGPSPAYRIKQGETVMCLVWSNSAGVILQGGFRVIYDDGDEAWFALDAVTTDATRSSMPIYSGMTASQDGYVVEASLNWAGVLNQRGNVYVIGFITKEQAGANSQIVQLLYQDYIFPGNHPTLGKFVQPGPAGGTGSYRTITGTNQAAGTLPVDSVPAGAFWRIRSYQAVLVTDGTAGNRSFALVVDAGATTGRVFAVNNPNTQAATLTRTWAWFVGTDASATVGATFTDTDILLPSYTLKENMIAPAIAGTGNYRLRLVSTGTLAFTATDDFAAPIIEVEEWVMPS